MTRDASFWIVVGMNAAAHLVVLALIIREWAQKVTRAPTIPPASVRSTKARA